MSAEFVGGALFSSFLQVTFDKLASQFVDFFRGRKVHKMLLSKLKMKLQSIDALANDAEQKQFKDPRVRDWLLKAKDIAFEPEDVLDEIEYELYKCEVEAESRTTADKVRSFFRSSFVSSFDKEIESRMEQVLDDLDDLASQSGYLGLMEVSGVGVGSGLSMSQKLPSTSLLVENVIYGRDGDKEMIFNWLTSDTHNASQLSILSIVGMGGMGKTTLAQHVYNDPRIDETKFGIKAWVCVSDDFDVLKVSRSILEAIYKSKDKSTNLEMVHGRLKEILIGKKFLLVLDDIWNENQKNWEAVQTPLNYGARGSRILVTTRSTKVASIVRSNIVHNLMQLQEDQCWKVFAEHAFQNGNSQLNAELKEIGIKIVEKCKGSPLALKSIGSLLYKKSSISEWECVLTSEIWDLENSEIIPALLLSYYHLPSHLKRCFAFCALFPKDYEFDKESLIFLWMAENFLRSLQQNKNPGEVGEWYFDDLLSRSFFQQSCRYKNRFVMHDLLNELAKYVCGDICFRFGVDKVNNKQKMTRHFSFLTDHVLHFDGFESLCGARSLRTFMPTCGGISYLFNSWHCMISIHELFLKFKFLYVLSLSCCYELIEVPESLGNLKHLRSLDLSKTSIKRLPDSTCSLYNLQILKLGFCDHLEELPSNLHKLTNLKRLDFIDTKMRNMPQHLGKLTNLQVSGSFYVGKNGGFNIQQLGEFNLCGRLSIGELQNIENPLDASKADLKNKTHIVELELEWNCKHYPDDSMRERDVFENLQPPKYLQYLSIKNYGGTQFSSWLFGLNMLSLRLSDCKYCLCLPPLGLLPFLKHLTVTGFDRMVSIDAKFYGNGSSSFTSLETLKFIDMKEWEEWECKAVTCAFPRLQCLSIMYCPLLKGDLPEQLLNLKTLEIRDCKKLVACVPRALEIQELELWDCGNLQFDYHPITLKRLTIRGHNIEASVLERIGQIISYTSLELLGIYSCLNMNIPMGCCYDFLVTLKISDGCDSLTTFPLDFFPKLCSLDLVYCRNLQMISQGHTHNHLKDLNITGCPHFELFPKEGLSAPWLKIFSIKGLENLKSLPKHMHILLPSLTFLSINDCAQVESFSDGGLPSNLERMDLSNCSKLIASLKGALGVNTSLKTLSIGKLDVESFPDDDLLPLSLTSLEIYDCPNLKKLDYKGLCQLSSLHELSLHGCPILQCLPKEGLPKSISTLKIRGNCSLLKQRCQKLKGKDWGKIAHIQNLWFYD